MRKRWKDEDGNIWEWDSQHGELEKYSPKGKHLGAFDPDTGEQLKPGPDFVLSILSGTLNSFVMAVLALNLKATTAGDGIMLGLVVWAGFFLSYMTANTVFAKRPWGLWAIDVGHALVAQVVLAVIVTLIR